MNAEAGQDSKQGIPAWVWLSGGALAAAIAVLVVLAVMKPESHKKTGPVATEIVAENPLQMARELLNGRGDLASCRQAITNLNKARMAKAATSQNATASAKAYPDDVPQKNHEYLSSLTSPGMDAWYLEECLYFREVLQSGDFSTKAGSDAPSQLRAVTELWDWVVREVALIDSKANSTLRAPLHWVLKRGMGSSEERALIFLAMLRQSGIPKATGCLIRFSANDSPFQLLACVRTSDGLHHLYDPKVGLPLSLVSGGTLQGLGTGAFNYQIWTGKQVSPTEAARYFSGARCGIPVSMQSLAPRNVDFSELRPEDSLTVPSVEIDTEINQWKASFAAAGLAEIKVGPDLEMLQRWSQFLPPGEGGEASPGAPLLFSFTYVPWDLLAQEVLEAHPLLSRIPSPSKLGVPLPQPVGERLLFSVYAPVFSAWYETPDKGRDLLVRFQFARLVPDLKQEKEEIQGRLDKTLTDEDRQYLREWIAAANRLYAGMARNPGDKQIEDQIKSLWDRAGPMVMLVLFPAANARMNEIQIALALSKHEQAAQLVRKLARRSPGVTQAEVTKAWRSASEVWSQLSGDSKSPVVVKVLSARYQGEALWRAGDIVKARTVWQENSSGDLPDAKACFILAKSNQNH